MPVYLCHGFQWKRHDIRVFVIRMDVEEASPDWIIRPATSKAILRKLYEMYDFIPEPRTANVAPTISLSKDPVLMHSRWSAVKLLEADTDSLTIASLPYAYVADHVVRMDPNFLISREIANYEATLRDQNLWINELQGELEGSGEIGWYYVECSERPDPVTAPPEENDFVLYKSHSSESDLSTRTLKARNPPVLQGGSTGEASTSKLTERPKKSTAQQEGEGSTN